ncbi:MAG: hypothetical protein HZA53_19535 [Planctomycetes bacterium]|nr:hypothetical protein [Planctomycetota bacterium]
MAKQSRSLDAAPEGTAEALAHARIAWEAEVENARRLAQRTALLITIEAALLGVGAARAFAAIDSSLTRGLLACSAGFVLAGLTMLLRPRRRGREPAQSSLLLLGNPQMLSHAHELPRVRVARHVLQMTVHATMDLGRRNSRKQRDIDHAQIGLLLAGSSWIAAVLCWLVRGTGS